MRKKPIKYIALVYTASVLVSGCAGVNEKDKVIQGLSDRISALQTSVKETNTKVEDLSAKVLLINAKTDATGKAVERLSSMPSAPPQGLAVVKLGEEPERKADAPFPVVLTNGAQEAKAPAGTPRPEAVNTEVLKVETVRPPVAQTALPQKAEKPLSVEKKDKTGAKASDVGSGADAQSLYDKGLELYNGGSHEDARRLLTSLVKSYPDHLLADNALYWIGESYYSEKDFETAAARFSEVFNIYPGSNKAPDALLKAGYSYIELKRPEKAVEALEYVVKRYPATEAAAMAQKALKGFSGAKKEGAR
ncbi:MAG: tol-pal system protein YbgF [Deltaproteobacteria bacterium]